MNQTARVVFEFLTGFFVAAATAAATLTAENGAKFPAAWPMIVAAIGSVAAGWLKVQSYLSQPAKL
jgi:hypothetical protein